jgi:hypothetical protein
VAANRGVWGLAAVTKRTHRVALRPRNLKYEPTGVGEVGAANRANEPTQSSARLPDGANEATVMAVGMNAPIGGIASSLRGEAMTRDGKTKPR